MHTYTYIYTYTYTCMEAYCMMKSTHVLPSYRHTYCTMMHVYTQHTTRGLIGLHVHPCLEPRARSQVSFIGMCTQAVAVLLA